MSGFFVHPYRSNTHCRSAETRRRCSRSFDRSRLSSLCRRRNSGRRRSSCSCSCLHSLLRAVRGRAAGPVLPVVRCQSVFPVVSRSASSISPHPSSPKVVAVDASTRARISFMYPSSFPIQPLCEAGGGLPRGTRHGGPPRWTQRKTQDSNYPESSSSPLPPSVVGLTELEQEVHPAGVTGFRLVRADPYAPRVVRQATTGAPDPLCAGQHSRMWPRRLDRVASRARQKPTTGTGTRVPVIVPLPSWP